MATPTDGAGAASAMRAALVDAGFEPARVGYVNAHATGTRAGDAAESAALLEVFGDALRTGAVAVSSTKGATGHLLGAAGAVEAAFAAMAVCTGDVPPRFISRRQIRRRCLEGRITRRW